MDPSKTKIDEATRRNGGNKLPQYLAATIVNLSAFATGVVIGWPSPMLPLLQQSPSPLGDDVDTISADSSSWLGSLMCLGGLLATPAYSYMGNRHSRKLTGYLVGLPGVIGWLLVLNARSELMLFAGRLFLGFQGRSCARVIKDKAVLRLSRSRLCSGYQGQGCTQAIKAKAVPRLSKPRLYPGYQGQGCTQAIKAKAVLRLSRPRLYPGYQGQGCTQAIKAKAVPRLSRTRLYPGYQGQGCTQAIKDKAVFSTTIGFGGAGNTILCPLYVMEIVEDDIRGSLGTYLVLFTNGGILFAYVLGSYASYTTFSAICLAIPITFMASFFWLPDTPVYLFNQNNPVAARRALQWLRGGHLLSVEQEMTKLVEAADKGKDNRSSESSFIKNLTSKGTLRGLLIGVGLMVNNQLSGIFAVLSYTVNIFQDAGSDISPNLCTIMVGVLQLFGVYLTSTLIDRAGRKILLIVSNIASAVCLAALGSFFYLKGHGYDVTDIGWLPVTSLSVYVVAIALGVGSIPFIIINEIFTPQMRGFAVTVCICTLNALAFLVARFFTDLNLLLGLDGCYWFFALCCLASTFFCYFVVPETKNKSLDSILKNLAGEEITFKKADERIKVPV
uniref:Major facilitator superfamily (MFS) profile domain-containing protein n=1 Tax=Timema monikensis TaxID=170555 RepID=A0A7R9DZB4_9NEOP|nr:unnamed protein product [Timema monikensis]